MPLPPEPSQSPTPTEESGLRIQREAGLAKLPNEGSPALSEIISRSLVHIQTSRALGIRQRIGEHELCGPDYRLVCTWAEELRLTPEVVLKRLLKEPKWAKGDCTTIGHS